MEIYMEKLRDLILPDEMMDSPPKLEIRKDTSTGSTNAVHVPNLTEIDVDSFQRTWNIMQKGSLNRSKGRTDMHDHSSRSHLIVRVTVRCDKKESGGCTRGLLPRRLGKNNQQSDDLVETFQSVPWEVHKQFSDVKAM